MWGGEVVENVAELVCVVSPLLPLPFRLNLGGDPALRRSSGKVESSPRLSLLSPNMDVINWPSNTPHIYQQNTQDKKRKNDYK